jgi:serine/threonine protein kinase/Tfp pilus assembly protein PilF
MKTTSRVCENCGEKIFGDAPKGLCPACVLETGLGPLADEIEEKESTSPPRNSAVAHSAGVLMDFGDYELLEEIGRGGQGVVYRARHKSLNRTVALKVIGLGQWATKAHLKRFRREAEAAANLDHPCIVPIYEVGEREGSCYFSMKFIDGGQLDEVVKRQPISLRNVAELIAKLARTIHYAHEHGILHRDIKPGNILLDAKGEPHLTDFGLARLLETKSTVTHTMDVLGTPSYMAPEQASGLNEQLTSATDVYGLGAVFYQLLTGHPPFAGGTTYETIRLLLDTEPRQPRLWNPKIDRELSTICLKCLEKDPKRRYSSALALAEDLEHWLKHEPIRAKRSGFSTRAWKLVRRNPSTAVFVILLVALGVSLGLMIWKRESAVPVPKSIAVLPFENLSGDPDNAYFAEGIQEEILTRLASVADLKVISRTSTQQYQSKPRNLSRIAKQLDVAHLVEASVQRTDNHVRVNARLIDARRDVHLWAQTYDRDLKAVFAIQSEIAQAIADQLRAKISPSEKAAIEEKLTNDLVAYDLYVRAKPLIYYTPGSLTEKNLVRAVDLLNQAIARDPAFLLAYCQLAEAHDTLYFQGFDHTPGRLALAKSAIDSAFRLKPDSGEAHLALASHFYFGYLDYDHARDELAIAARTLPNKARLFELAGAIDRRQGRWPDAVRNFERAIELDPRNVIILNAAAVTYICLREYKQTRATLDRVLAITPKDIHTLLFRAQIDISERADTRGRHAAVEKALADDPTIAGRIVDRRFRLAMFERDPVAAESALAALTENSFSVTTMSPLQFSRGYAEGLVAQMKGDDDAARSFFLSARAQQEEAVRTQPEDASALCALGLIDAKLGRKEEALREGRQAVELLPVTKDAVAGPEILLFFAVICAQTGEHDLAIEQLETLAKIPAGPSYGTLRLDPNLDPLRGDPRFEKIVASLAPK